MFSSLQSFLPSALHLGSNNDNDEHDKVKSPAEQEEAQKQQRNLRKKKEKTANETFIFVRPPPTKTNHPLNLQVQLVPPGSKAPGGITTTPRHSIDGHDIDAQSTDGAELTRTPSNRSTASNYSTGGNTPSAYSASTSSFSSVSSSATGGRRTIVPLYNLQAHNVLTNVIVDAGTDAKIAKFQKRGMEILDLAVMEPLEVWALTGVPPALSNLSQTGVLAQSLNPESQPGSRVLRNSNSGIHSAKSSNFLNTNSGLRSSRPSTPDVSARDQNTSLSTSGVEGLPNLSSSDALTRTPNDSTSALSVSSAGIGSDALDHSFHRGRTTEQREPSAEEAVSPRKRNIFGKLFSSSKSQTSTPNQTTPTQSPAGSALAVSNEGTPKSHHARGVTESTPTQATRHARTGSAGAGFLSPGVALTSFGASLGNLRKRGESPNPEGNKRNSSSKRSSLMIIPTPAEVNLNSSSNSAPGTATANQEDFSEFGVTGGTPQTSQFLGQPTPTLLFGPALATPTAGTSKEAPLLPATLGVQPLLSSLLPFPFPMPPSATYPPNLNAIVAKMIQQSLGGPTGNATAASSISSKHSVESFSRGSGDTTMEVSGILSGIGGTKGPVMYVWIIKKWLKGDSSSIFGNLTSLSKRGSAVGPKGGVETRVEVRIEWKRSKEKEKESKNGKGRKDKEGKTANKSKRDSLRRESLPAEADSSSRRGSKVFASTSSLVPSGDESVTGASQNGDNKDKKKKNRLSLNRLSFLSTGGSATGSASDLAEDASRAKDFAKSNPDSARPGGKPTAPPVSDDGEDSDREDSETPWVCTIKVRRLGGTGSAAPREALKGKDEKDGGVVRLKVGTLSPTPHHPKVVAMLKVPYPLPDIEVEPDVSVQPRFPTGDAPPQSSSGGNASPYPKLTMSAEEIKDVICSTGLWLVVREGFGGVGKVGRKGDGWRIRA